ncbi:MAG: paraquat-inducible protein A [Lacunisphaera sp.]
MNATRRSAAMALPTARSRPDEVLTLASTALVFYGASLCLPLATAAKFGEKHSGYLLSGVVSLWRENNGYLAGLVFGCGILAPLLLAGALTFLLAAARAGRPRPALRGWLHFATRLETWSMPEVQVLGVVVAFIKLSALVPSRPAAGLWCYGLAALFSVAAWRRFDAAAIARVLFPETKEGKP